MASDLLRTKKALLDFVEKHPEDILGQYNLGTIYRNGGNLNKAIRHFQSVLSINPSFLPARNNLGLCLRDKGYYTEAIDIYRRTLELTHSDPLVFMNLGSLYLETHNFGEAIKLFKKGLKLDPENLSLRLNLALVYSMIGRSEEVLTTLKRVKKRGQNDPKVSMMMGHEYFHLGRFTEAAKNYQDAMEFDYGYPHAASSLFMTKRKVCDWKDIEVLEKYLDITSNEDAWGSIVRSEDPGLNYIAAKKWSDQVENSVEFLKKKCLPYAHTKNTSKRKNIEIRIGYLSDNFASHPAGYMALELLRSHRKRGAIKCFAYAYGKNDGSECRKEIENTAEFVDINPLSDLEVVERMRRDEIDVLVDLSGYTVGSRSGVCALRPAPIQISWPEVLGTSGSDFIDYFVADDVLVPKEEKKYFSETLLYLPGCSYIRHFPVLPFEGGMSRKRYGLPEKGVVFGVFHQMFKIEPRVWKIWMKMLLQVPESVLWLWKQNEEGMNNLVKEAKKMGVGKERLIFTPGMPPAEFQARMSLADLALDTLVYGGGVTSFQTLAAGVPLLTVHGTHMASRVSTDLLLKIDADELVAKGEDEYLKKGVQLALNKDRLNVLRKYLRKEEVQKKLFDFTKTTSSFEEKILNLL